MSRARPRPREDLGCRLHAEPGNGAWDSWRCFASVGQRTAAMQNETFGLYFSGFHNVLATVGSDPNKNTNKIVFAVVSTVVRAYMYVYLWL